MVTTVARDQQVDKQVLKQEATLDCHLDLHYKEAATDRDLDSLAELMASQLDSMPFIDVHLQASKQGLMDQLLFMQMLLQSSQVVNVNLSFKHHLEQEKHKQVLSFANRQILTFSSLFLHHQNYRS